MLTTCLTVKRDLVGFFRGLLRTGLNGDLAAFASLLFDRHRYFDNSFGIRGARIVGPGAVRQRNGAIEFAVPPLGHMDAAFGSFVLLLPFPLDDNCVVRYLQFYFAGIETRKFRSHNVIAISLLVFVRCFWFVLVFVLPCCLLLLNTVTGSRAPR